MKKKKAIKAKQQLPGKKLALFEAAVKLIAEHGFHDSPTAKIADEAGIGIGTMYRYFKSKDQLIDETFDYVETEMQAAVTRNFSPDRPVKDQFVELCKNLIRYSFRSSRPVKFFNQYIDSPYGAAMRKYKHSRDADDIPQGTLLYPFYMVFDKAKKQHLIKDVSNILLFTLIYGAISNFLRDVNIGIIDYDANTESRVIEACWDTVKR